MNKSSLHNIPEVIYKSVIQSIDAQEEQILAQWLLEDKNRELYESILNGQVIKDKKKVYIQSNKEAVFARINKRIGGNSRKRIVRRRIMNTVRYAAILVLMLVIGKYYFNDSDDTIYNTIEALKDIKPGTDKAILVLDDGSTVDLETKTNRTIAENGQVKIVNSDQILSYESTNVASHEEMRYNTLKVPLGGIYQLILPDGTKVWLNSKSSLKYPVQFSDDERLVELEGEAFFDVTKSATPFIVRSQAADVNVLGTQFNISAYEDDTFYSTTLKEGSISFNQRGRFNESVILKPGEQAVISQKIIQVKKVDPSVVSAWINGKFYFESTSLAEILAKMSRWYGVDYSFEDESLKKKLFTGVASKNESIDQLLSLISETTNINFKIIKNDDNELFELVIFKKQ